MRRILPILFLVLCVNACGPLEPLPPMQGKQARVQPQTWQVPGLGQTKQAVVAAVKANGGDDRLANIVLAMLMAETVHGTSDERDASKDGSEAANYSAFNLNKACLKKLGWIEGQGPDLNKQQNIAEAVKWVLAGIRQLTLPGMLNFHRGGSCGFDDGVSYGCKDYRDAIFAIAAYIQTHPESASNDDRVGTFLQHV